MSTATAGPLDALPVAQRALAPDLARGAMLLLICLANVTVYLVGPVGTRGFPAADTMTTTDRVLTVVQLAFVDGRAFPLFGLLVGYGAWQLASRRLAAGASPRDVTRLLRRRGLALALVGTLHGLLLFAGDIAAAYGLLLVCFAGSVVKGRRRLVAVAVVGVVLVMAFGALISLGPPPESAEGSLAEGGGALMSVASSSALAATLWRIPEFVVVGIIGNTLGVLGVVAIGVLAARRGLLDDPARHLRLLRVVAVGGLSVAVLGGLPLGLVAAGAVQVGVGGVAALGALHSLTGYLGGAGYGALAGLVAARLLRPASAPAGSSSAPDGTGAAPTAAARPLPAGVAALTALGRRSLTGYLLHSVVFVAVLPLWSFGAGDDLGVTGATLLAVGTWLLMVGVAWAMETAGLRGPAEVLLRRLTYPRRRTA